MEPTKTQKKSQDDTMSIKMNDDGTFTIEWDPEDPVWSAFNHLSEEELQNIIIEEFKNNLIIEDSLTPEDNY